MTTSFNLSKAELRKILLKNWMTHDSLWYNEVADKFGMAEASPMNLRVCRKLGQIELRRLMKMVNAQPPSNMDEYRQLFELAKDTFVPEFIDFHIEYANNHTQVFQVKDCFAFRGMSKAGLISEYECGIFERIEGWFDAMGLKYERTPDLSHCLKFQGKECAITVRFHFE